MKRNFLVLVLLICTLLGTAWAQIGEPVDSLITRLSPYQVTETDAGYVSADGFSFATEQRGDAVYSVTGEGSLDVANIDFSSNLIGAATGYGDQIAQPVKEFFGSRISELAGQGQANLAVQQYTMAIEVSGDAAPYDVSFTLYLPEIDSTLFPETKHTLGPADAKYVIREFSDFQCPFCARFVSEAMPLIKGELLTRGDVRFEFHHLPLTSIHANALSAAEATECVTAANEPDAFWDYHDALFERQQAWQGLGDPNPYYVRLAQDIGLNAEGVAQCLEERTFADEVNAAYEVAAGTLGIGGTPSVYINGYKLGDYTQLSNYLDLIELSDKFAQAE